MLPITFLQSLTLSCWTQAGKLERLSYFKWDCSAAVLGKDLGAQASNTTCRKIPVMQ